MRKGVIEISPGRIRAFVSEVSEGPDGPAGRPVLGLDYGFSPLEASPATLGEMIRQAAAEVHLAGADDPEVLLTGDLRGSRLPVLVKRISRRLEVGAVASPSGRELVAGAFLAATSYDRPESVPDTAVFSLSHTFLGLAVGQPGHLPDWTASRPLAAGSVATRARFGDPPTEAQLAAATSAVNRSLGSLVPPGFGRSILVSEASSSLVSLFGPSLGAEAVRPALEEIARPLGSDSPDRETLDRAGRSGLLATLVICAAIIERFGSPLELMVPDLPLARTLLDEVTPSETRYRGGQ